LSAQIKPVLYGDMEVRFGANGFINLTDMWLAAGEPSGKHDPRTWKRFSGSEFIEFIAKKLNVLPEHIYQTKRGRGGGTWAHWQIALAYAKYLSPEFHAWANEVVKERVEEDASPELGIKRGRERAITAWRNQGKSESFIKARLSGIDARNTFTETLSQHGVDGMGYAVCTNSIYEPILGGKAAEVKSRRGLPPKASLRDNMSIVELTGTMFAEALASDRIEREDRQGLKPCSLACQLSGLQVQETISRHEQAIQTVRQASRKPPYQVEETRLGRRIEEIRAKHKSS